MTNEASLEFWYRKIEKKEIWKKTPFLIVFTDHNQIYEVPIIYDYVSMILEN